MADPLVTARAAIERLKRLRPARREGDIGYALRNGGWFQAPAVDAEIDIQTEMGGLPSASRSVSWEEHDRIERKWIAENTRLRQALVDIRDQEWVENTLDPQWAARIAEHALKGKDAK